VTQKAWLGESPDFVPDTTKYHFCILEKGEGQRSLFAPKI
jgi:hypothetical protein